MTIEIELKFIATAVTAKQLPTILAAWPHQHQPARRLTNTYFETADNQLRCWDMGLRIRGDGDHYEMTLKTAGNTVGGLYQRPEYNIELTQPVLNIHLFPTHVWPQGSDVDDLQQRLVPLFGTHYQREIWNVLYRGSEIEVALDQGDVVAGDRREPLREIELELKKGQREDLMALAFELGNMGGLHLGNKSKAARGYALAQQHAAEAVRPFPILKYPVKATIEQGMQSALLLALEHWQYHDTIWLRGDHNDEACTEITCALDTLRQIFVLFGGLVPRKASSALRQQLTVIEAMLADDRSDAAQCCYTPAWVQAQLMLTDWLIAARWRQSTDEKAGLKLQGSFKRFADIMLGRVAAELKKTFKQVAQFSEYQDKSVRLRHDLTMIPLLAGAYEDNVVASWLSPWQMLLTAIQQQEQTALQHLSQQAVQQKAFWLTC